MRKIILLTTVLLFSILSFGQKSDSTSIPDTAKLTLSKVYSDVKSGIQGLATALKVPANHVYEILIRQQLTYSIINICLMLGLFVSCFICAKYAKATYKGHIKLYSDSHDGRTNADLDDTAKGPLSVALTVISIVLGITGVIVLCTTMQETIIGFTNPEYGAIKEIVSFIK